MELRGVFRPAAAAVLVFLRSAPNRSAAVSTVSGPRLYARVRCTYDSYRPGRRTQDHLLVTANVEIRKLHRDDEPRWRELWNAYLRFYRHHLPEEITAATFQRLADPAGDIHGLVAESGGTLVGFVNYLYHASSGPNHPCVTWRIFSWIRIPAGAGAGRALIFAVYAAADAGGAQGVYWMTQEFNADGRALYDTLARRTSFIKYER